MFSPGLTLACRRPKGRGLVDEILLLEAVFDASARRRRDDEDCTPSSSDFTVVGVLFVPYVVALSTVPSDLVECINDCCLSEEGFIGEIDLRVPVRTGEISVLRVICLSDFARLPPPIGRLVGDTVAWRPRRGA